MNVITARTVTKLLSSTRSFLSFVTQTHTTTMSTTTTTTTTHPGLPLQDVVSKLESYAPTSLAESWDNVGLLCEPSSPHHVHKLFLTNDLTEPVLDEAVRVKADMILSYHPPIFSSIKRITQTSWKNRIVVKALENRVAVYSPHTCYDALNGGVNDWLISCFEGDVTPITPKGEEEGSGIGMGRICKLHTPLSIDTLVHTLKTHLQLAHVRVGYPLKVVGSNDTNMVGSIACCAGSGGGLLRDVCADVYVTGEMSHHECLDAVSNGRTVVLCEHSNTERGFLRQSLKNTLMKLLDGKVDVLVSDVDKDPLVIV